MYKVLSILLVALALGYISTSSKLVEAQRFASGYCPTVAAQENFDKTKFFGNWIEVEKTPSIFDLMMRCMVVDYSDDQDNTVNVVVRGVSLAGLPLTVNGDGLLQDVHRSGFYAIRYGFGVPFQGTQTTVVDTDYEDYAVVYSCTNSLLSGVFHSEYIWLLSRSGKISNPTRQNIYEKLDKLNINRSGLTMSDRSTCPSNSSLVRESEKDLASGQPLAGASAAPKEAQAAQASEMAQAPASSPSVTLEKANPAPVESKVQGQKLSPLAPVENKIQLPLSSAVLSAQAQGKQQAAPVKPAPSQQQQAVAAASGPAASPSALPAGSASSSIQSKEKQSSLLNKIQPPK